ncbi:hypothetical protein HDV01_007766 [Terramyces sp. JEL0728]|nr:hypothetical protein HDV01_007766 [Terramyces sp. JEL0728]
MSQTEPPSYPSLKDAVFEYSRLEEQENRFQDSEENLKQLLVKLKKLETRKLNSNDEEIDNKILELKSKVSKEKADVAKLKYIRGRLAQIFNRVFRSAGSTFDSEQKIFDKYNYWKSKTTKLRKQLASEEEALTLVQLIISTFANKVQEYALVSSKIKLELQLIDYLFSNYKAAKLLNPDLANDLLPGITVDNQVTCPTLYTKYTYTVEQLCQTIEKQKGIVRKLTRSINTKKRQLKEHKQDLHTYLLELENEQRSILRGLMVTWDSGTEDLPPEYEEITVQISSEDSDEDVPLAAMVGSSNIPLSISIPTGNHSGPLSPPIDFRSPFSPVDSDDDIPLGERYSRNNPNRAVTPISLAQIDAHLPVESNRAVSPNNLQTTSNYQVASPVGHTSTSNELATPINNDESTLAAYTQPQEVSRTDMEAPIEEHHIAELAPTPNCSIETPANSKLVPRIDNDIPPVSLSTAETQNEQPNRAGDTDEVPLAELYRNMAVLPSTPAMDMTQPRPECPVQETSPAEE